MSESTLIPVAVACPCPGTPHDGDSVYLFPSIGLHGGIVAQNIIVSNKDQGELQASLLDCYVRYGVADWTFTDENGNKLSGGVDFILRDWAIGAAVADKADDLYTMTVLDPLRKGASTSSARTPANGSTSPQTVRSSKPRKQPKPSSTTTTPTDDTASPS